MHAILAPSTDCSSSKLPLIFPCRPGTKTRKHSSNLQLKSYIRVSADPIAWCHSLEAIARVIAASAPFLCLISALTVFESSAVAQTATRSDSTDRFAEFIDEASGRFAVPARWIRAVMQVESGGDQHAMSTRGGMGVMQLMPRNPAERRVRFELGPDPVHTPHHNLARTDPPNRNSPQH